MPSEYLGELRYYDVFHTVFVLSLNPIANMSQKSLIQFSGGTVKKRQREEISLDINEPKSKACRKFRPDWLKEYERLMYDDEKDLMFCSWCLEAKKPENWYYSIQKRGVHICIGYRRSVFDTYMYPQFLDTVVQIFRVLV